MTMATFNGKGMPKYSLEEFEKFTKEELLEIAEKNQIPIDKRLKLENLRTVLAWLVEKDTADMTETEEDFDAPLRIPADTGLAVASPKSERSGLSPGLREAGAKSEGRTDQPSTRSLPDPLSGPSSPGSSTRLSARHKLRLEQLRMEAEEKEKERKARMQIEIKRLELETEKAVRIRQLELEAQSRPSARVFPDALSSTSQATPFDVSKYVNLFPIFRESEVDSYFPAFERIAMALKCPEEVWSILLQCKIQGKAQEVIAALPISESMSYESVKTAIQRAYELVPEAYRQKFRSHKKAQGRTHVEFAREKGTLFDKWCASAKCDTFSKLRELILLEDFKKNLPDKVVVYLNEQKAATLTEASVLADEFVLTHRNTFVPNSERASSAPEAQPNSLNSGKVREQRECFYCRKPGHVISNCLALKRKADPSAPKPKGVGLIKMDKKPNTQADPCFEPFIFDGLVSLPGETSAQRPIRILRDTGGSQTVILASALPFSAQSSCGYGSVLRGIEMGYSPRPVHFVHIESKLVTGTFPVAVCPELPISGDRNAIGE